MAKVATKAQPEELAQVDREELVEVLKIVSPALADNDVVPILSYFWFSGEHVTTYNDRIGMRTPYASPFKGAIHKHLLPILQNSAEKVVEVEEVEDQNLLLYLGGTTLTAKLVPPESFPKDLPKESKGLMPVDTADLVHAIEHSLHSALQDSVVPEEMGVSLETDGDILRLYSTNNATMGRANVTLTGPLKLARRTILPTKFCYELKNLFGTDPKLKIYLTPDYILVKAGTTYLYSRLITPGMKFDYNQICSTAYSDKRRRSMIKVPEGLLPMVLRAIVITDKDPNEMHIEIMVKDEQLQLHAQSEAMQIDDVIGFPKHPDTKLMKLEPRLFKLGLEHFNKILVTDSSVIMHKTNKKGDSVVGDDLFLIAGKGKNA